MNDGWYLGLFPFIYKSHMEIFKNVHAEQKADPQKLPLLIFKFYRGLMSMGWNAGWENGEIAAEKQFADRIEKKYTNHLEVARSNAARMEQSHLLENTLRLFNSNRSNQQESTKSTEKPVEVAQDGHDDDTYEPSRTRERMTA